jgi:hypothetical protein
VGQAKLSLAASKDAASVVDAAMGGGKPVTLSHRDYLPGGKGSVFSSHAGAYYDKQKKQYFKVLRETMTPAEWSQMSGGPGDHPVHDPQRLYDLVRGTIPQLGRKATVNLIRAKTGMRGWAPGKNMAYTGASLQSMPLGALEGIARDAGFPRAIRKAGRQALVDFILARTHGPSNPGTNP